MQFLSTAHIPTLDLFYDAEYILDKPMDRGTRSWTVFEEKMYMTALAIYSTEESPYIKYDITFESDLKSYDGPSWNDWSSNKFIMVNGQ